MPTLGSYYFQLPLPKVVPLGLSLEGVCLQPCSEGGGRGAGVQPVSGSSWPVDAGCSLSAQGNASEDPGVTFVTTGL